MNEDTGQEWAHQQELEHEEFKLIEKMEIHALAFRRWLEQQKIIKPAGVDYDNQ